MAKPPALAAVFVLAGTTVYLFRVAFVGDPTEYPFAASRVLMVAAIFAFFVLARERPVETSFHWITLGVLILSALALYIGTTGTNFLEPPRPARSFGVELPVMKTAGVPRSYGEQGIFYALAISYFLGYRSRFPAWAQIPIVALLLGGAIVSQSRNVYLAVVVVVAAWYLIVSPGRYLALRVVVIAASIATFVVQFLLQFLAQTPVIAPLVGEGIYERNVYRRFTLLDAAQSFVSEQPLRALVGFDHHEWRTTTMGIEEVGLHNNFAASLVHLGLVAGAITLVGLFFLPAFRVISQLEAGDLDDAQSRVRKVCLTALVGALISLNFYEGFFSLVLAFLVAVLWIASCSPQSKNAGQRR